MMRALERFYRVLLYLYPASFRNEYGRALTATFVARLRDMSGPARPLLGALAAVGDVVPNAIAAHWEILRHDVRYAGRSLRASPGFTLTAILVIALGVGANTAAFSLADFVLLRPLPFHEPDRLVDLWESTPGYPHMEFSPANYRDMKAMTHSFAAMGAYSDRTMNLVGTGEPRHLTVGIMTPHAMPFPIPTVASLNNAFRVLPHVNSPRAMPRTMTVKVCVAALPPIPATTGM